MTPDGKKVALVLSGGGASGAYEVGVLRALMSGRSHVTGFQPLVPDIVTGTSIGALNAAFLVSMWNQFGPDSAGRLERFWLDQLSGGVRSNGIYRLRGNPLELLDPRTYFSDPAQALRRFADDSFQLSWGGLQRMVHFFSAQNESIERRVVELVDLTLFMDLSPYEETLSHIDYQAIRRSDLWLKIAATNWATGELRLFWNHDMTDNFGPVAVRASSSVPGLFPPAEYGSQPFVDGSILLQTPLSAAIHAGAQVLHVVYLDPDISNIPISGLRETYSSVFRIFQIAWASAYNRDIENAARINRSLAALKRARTELGLDEQGIDVVEEVAQLNRAPGQADYHPLTIHRYHPTDPLEGELSFLNFDRDRLQTLIERGFQDAVYHDFDESRDVFPNAEEAAAARRFNPRRVRPA